MKHSPKTNRIFGRRISVDGIPGRSGATGAPSVVDRDFAFRRFESVVFSRDHRIVERFVSSGKSRSLGDVRRKSISAVDDIRRKQQPLTLNEESWFGRVRLCLESWVFVVCEGVIRMGATVKLSPRMALRTSLIAAILFGSVSTILTYRYLGGRVLAAREEREASSVIVIDHPAGMIPESPLVLGESDESNDRFAEEVIQSFEDIQEAEKKNVLEAKIREMVAGYPIENMVPYIMEKDRIVAAFLVGIAKKESAWGKRVPLLKSHDCFNYWGYRGKRRFMGTGGHTCFNSPKDAVDTVSRRLEKLIYTEKIDTPAEMMVVWKCGYDCSTHNKADTKKWISDVNLYFHQLDEED